MIFKAPNIKNNNLGSKIITTIENSSKLSNLLVFSFFLLFSSTANWSIVLGENVMQWDVWDSIYPNMVLVSDALKAGTYPFWNPLYRYGAPMYAMIGSAPLYPIYIVFAIFGYKINTIAISYVLHSAIAGFGMFLLTKQELIGHELSNKVCLGAALISGLLYSECGLFLSNAEHDTILVAVAWTPYVLYFLRSYLYNRKLSILLNAAICASMMLLGGYPEVFYGLFIILIPYTVYFNVEMRKKNDVKALHNAAGVYLLLCLFTVLAAAAVVLPFIFNIGLTSRGTVTGVEQTTYDYKALLTMLFPGAYQFVAAGEISMYNFYAGIITILLSPIILKRDYRNRIFFMVMTVVSFLMCWGNNSFLCLLLHRFLPKYSAFRFPTLNRAFFIIFLLLLTADSIGFLLTKKETKSVSVFGTIIAAFCIVLGILSALAGNILPDTVVNQNTIAVLSHSAFATGLILLMYVVFLSVIGNRKLRTSSCFVLLLFSVCIEVFSFVSVETPLTIAQAPATRYINSVDWQNTINSYKAANANRNRNVNFAENSRSTSGLDSRSIVYNKTFDEEGYVNFIPAAELDYINTYIRSITEENPEVYFTNNIVSDEDCSYKDWANCGSVPRNQIYIEGYKNVIDTDRVIADYDSIIKEEENLAIINSNGTLIINGDFPDARTKVGHIRLYFDTNTPESALLKLCFTDTSDDVIEHEDLFPIKLKNGRRYADVYMPNASMAYKQIKISSWVDSIESASYITTERKTTDEYSNVDLFSFNTIKVNVTAPTEGVVTILQNKHPGWKAYVDGNNAEIKLVNGDLMGVEVQPGKHFVELRFRPIELLIGLFLSAAFYVFYIIIRSKEYKNNRDTAKAGL